MPSRGLNCCLYRLPLVSSLAEIWSPGREQVVADAGVEHEALVLPPILDVGRALGVVVQEVGAIAAREPVGLDVRERERQVLDPVVAWPRCRSSSCAASTAASRVALQRVDRRRAIGVDGEVAVRREVGIVLASHLDVSRPVERADGVVLPRRLATDGGQRIEALHRRAATSSTVLSEIWFVHTRRQAVEVGVRSSARGRACSPAGTCCRRCVDDHVP